MLQLLLLLLLRLLLPLGLHAVERPQLHLRHGSDAHADRAGPCARLLEKRLLRVLLVRDRRIERGRCAAVALPAADVGAAVPVSATAAAAAAAAVTASANDSIVAVVVVVVANIAARTNAGIVVAVIAAHARHAAAGHAAHATARSSAAYAHL